MGSSIIFLVILGIILFKYVGKKVNFPGDIYSDDNMSNDNTPNDQKKTSNDTQQQARQTNQQPQPAIKPVVQSNLNGSQRLYGIIGKPLQHSISSSHFKKMFKENSINADYCNFEIDNAAELMSLINLYPNLYGLNVTIPYKKDVIQFMDQLDETAQQVEAVNVIRIEHTNGNVRLIGYNTDAIGFMNSISPLVGDRKKALILGTGGASKAVKYGLNKLGIESRFVSRNSSFDVLGYYELSPSIIEDNLIIVNCTPVGMWPDVNNFPEIPYAYLTSQHLLYDVIYNPEETMFMQKGKYYGATVKNGYEMWKLQAEETWRIWNR